MYTQKSDTTTQTESIILTLDNDIETLVTVDQNLLPDKFVQELHDKLTTTLAQYSGMDPIARSKCPKLRYSPKLFRFVNLFNENILKQFISNYTQLIDIHTLVYCTAVVISEELNFKIAEYTRSSKPRHNIKPPWQQRLEKDIEKLRADCGRLRQYINNNRSNKVVRSVEAIFQRSFSHTKYENSYRKPEEFVDTLKQKLALKVHRLRRYKKLQ